MIYDGKTGAPEGISSLKVPSSLKESAEGEKVGRFLADKSCKALVASSARR
jgi:hypothetical protein